MMEYRKETQITWEPFESWECFEWEEYGKDEEGNPLPGTGEIKHWFAFYIGGDQPVIECEDDILPYDDAVGTWGTKCVEWGRE